MVTLLKASCSAIRHKAKLRAVLVLVSAFSLSSCAWFQFPGVFRIDIQQGNILTQEMVDQLQLGMSKRQVNFVLGTPMIQDSFNQDRWDYFYSLTNSSREVSERRFTVYFRDDLLISTEGDFELNAEPAPESEPTPEPELDQLNEGFSSNDSSNEKTNSGQHTLSSDTDVGDERSAAL